MWIGSSYASFRGMGSATTKLFQMPGMAEETPHTGSGLPTPMGSITLLVLSFYHQYFVF